MEGEAFRQGVHAMPHPVSRTQTASWTWRPLQHQGSLYLLAAFGYSVKQGIDGFGLRSEERG